MVAMHIGTTILTTLASVVLPVPSNAASRVFAIGFVVAVTTDIAVVASTVWHWKGLPLWQPF